MATRRALRTGKRMCEVTNGSTTVNVVGTTEGLAVGDRVVGPGIPAGATIATLAAASFTLSAAASFPSPPYPANYAIQTQLAFEGQLANPGSAAPQTHASIPVDDLIGGEVLSFEFEVSAVVTSVTPKFQGSMDGSDVADSASDWFDLAVLPPAAAAETTTPAAVTVTGVNEYACEVARHPARKVRLVTTTAGSGSYEADVYAVDTG